MNVNYDNNDKKNWNKDKSAYDHHNYDWYSYSLNSKGEYELAENNN